MSATNLYAPLLTQRAAVFRLPIPKLHVCHGAAGRFWRGRKTMRHAGADVTPRPNGDKPERKFPESEGARFQLI